MGRPGSRKACAIVERRARFSIKIQDNFKLISDYPSESEVRTCQILGRQRWSGGLHSSARNTTHRLLNELEGRVSKFMFRASANSRAEHSARVGRALPVQNTGRFRVSDSQGWQQPARYSSGSALAKIKLFANQKSFIAQYPCQ